MEDRLPWKVTESILTFPEDSMGAYRVALILKDGSVIEDVIVAWGEQVVRVDGHDGCPFNVDDVVDALDRSRVHRKPL